MVSGAAPKRKSGTHAALRKKQLMSQRLKFQLKRALPSGELVELTPDELLRFTNKFPHIAQRWTEAGGAGSDPSSWQGQCEQLLDSLMSQKVAIHFLEPVNPVALGIKDYFTIVKEPMDLGTVKMRLRGDFYAEPAQFEAHVRLTFANAMQYNPAFTEVHECAKQLLKKFESLKKAKYSLAFKSAGADEPELLDNGCVEATSWGDDADAGGDDDVFPITQPDEQAGLFKPVLSDDDDDGGESDGSGGGEGSAGDAEESALCGSVDGASGVPGGESVSDGRQVQLQLPSAAFFGDSDGEGDGGGDGVDGGGGDGGGGGQEQASEHTLEGNGERLVAESEGAASDQDQSERQPHDAQTGGKQPQSGGKQPATGGKQPLQAVVGGKHPVSLDDDSASLADLDSVVSGDEHVSESDLFDDDGEEDGEGDGEGDGDDDGFSYLGEGESEMGDFAADASEAASELGDGECGASELEDDDDEMSGSELFGNAGEEGADADEEGEGEGKENAGEWADFEETDS